MSLQISIHNPVLQLLSTFFFWPLQSEQITRLCRFSLPLLSNFSFLVFRWWQLSLCSLPAVPCHSEICQHKGKPVFSIAVLLGVSVTLQSRPEAQAYTKSTQNEFRGNFADSLFHFALLWHLLSCLIFCLFCFSFFAFFCLFLVFCCFVFKIT